MAPREIRSATLGEIRVLSMASLYDRLNNKGPKSGTDFLEKLKDGKKDALSDFADCFVPVGLAKQIRLDEDWGTQPVYGIGEPTRPFLVPGNYQVSASIERLQLDGRNNFSYITSPDYWYSKYTQRLLGNTDWGMYTYLFIHDRERGNGVNSFNRVEIYALMPRSASKAISSGDVMVVHSVQMVGFKYQYTDFVGSLLGKKDAGLIGYGRTVAGTAENEFGKVINGLQPTGSASGPTTAPSTQSGGGGQSNLA